jgi:hypothetical protein
MDDRLNLDLPVLARTMVPGFGIEKGECGGGLFFLEMLNVFWGGIA